MHIFGCLIFFIFGIFIVLLSIFGSVIRATFRLKKTIKDAQKKATNTSQDTIFKRKEKSKKKYHPNRKNDEKIFSKNEGEYIDFEDIK